MPGTIDMEELSSLIETDTLFLLDVYAGWCHPCKLLEPELEALEKTYPGLKIFKIDYDSADGLSDRLGIRSLPLLLLFGEGKEILRIKGFYKKDRIIELIKEANPEFEL